jgi:hypothetical protein
MITKGQVFVVMISLIFILGSFVPYAFLKRSRHQPFHAAREEILKIFPDIDGDLLDDNIEINITFTSINSPDSDADFLPDGAEYVYWNETYIRVGLEKLRPTGDADNDGLTNILDPDSDNDFVPDGWEFENGLELWKQDTDNDGRSDRFDYYIFYNFDESLYLDNDFDQMPDVWENYFEVNDPEVDEDGDGVNNINEWLNGSDPIVKDDRYGFTGFQNEYSDTDEDGLTDRLEHAIGLDPNNYDSDFDGLPDGFEIINGSLPFDPDTDNDNITDGYEDYNGLSATSQDSDKDNLNDREEDELVTDPLIPDTNRNLVSDGDEPYAKDFDRDGLPNLIEMDDSDGYTTDPMVDDSDGDGLLDGDEDSNKNGRREGNDPTDSFSDWGRGGETDPNNDDTDEGGLPDGIEISLSFDPLDPSDDDTDIEWEPLELPDREPPEEFEIDYTVCYLILLIILIFVIAIVASYYLRKRREKLIKDLIEILEEGERVLYELDTSDDIRNAIYEVYISFQNSLAEFSLFRKKSMTVREFEKLIGERLPLQTEPVSRLTEVFEEARYSDHKLGISSKNRAIKSFREIRLDLTKYREEMYRFDVFGLKKRSNDKTRGENRIKILNR